MNSLQPVCKKEAQAVEELVAKVYFSMCRIWPSMFMENILGVIFLIFKENYYFQILLQLVNKRFNYLGHC